MDTTPKFHIRLSYPLPGSIVLELTTDKAMLLVAKDKATDDAHRRQEEPSSIADFVVRLVQNMIASFRGEGGEITFALGARMRLARIPEHKQFIVILRLLQLLDIKIDDRAKTLIAETHSMQH